MKLFFFVLAFVGYSVSFGQVEVHPTPKLNISWSITDYSMHTFGLEGSYRLGRHAIIAGYGNVNGAYSVGDRLEQNRPILTGYTLKLNHKLYLSGEDGFYLAIVHGPLFQNYTLPYTEKGWIPFTEDGARYYRYGDVTKNYHAQRVGYDARINMEYLPVQFLSFDFGMGFSYRALITNNPLPENYEIEDPFNGIAFEGIRPSFQLRIGFYIDGFY